MVVDIYTLCYVLRRIVYMSCFAGPFSLSLLFHLFFHMIGSYQRDIQILLVLMGPRRGNKRICSTPGESSAQLVISCCCIAHVLLCVFYSVLLLLACLLICLLCAVLILVLRWSVVVNLISFFVYFVKYCKSSFPHLEAVEGEYHFLL